MVDRWEAPAKLNLSLQVRSVDHEGYHPLRSLVQTVEWTDVLEVTTGEEHHLLVDGVDIDPGPDNLVWKAVRALVGQPDRPRLEMVLRKRIPDAAGLGGGSSDAAAALEATARVYSVPRSRLAEVAASVGSDVPFFLKGGSAWMEGRGERLTPVLPLAGFAVAIAVPPIPLSTPEVFRTWDEMDEPRGTGIAGRDLPPALREHGELVNDLLPAALVVVPELGDFMSHISQSWGRPVAMTGSGSAVFGYFADLDEAADAARAIDEPVRAAVGAALRPVGVRRLEAKPADR
jgi:4-diphosphocytidyl-2-C-methyl-D-erythritol kinase